LLFDWSRSQEIFGAGSKSSQAPVMVSLGLPGRWAPLSNTAQESGMLNIGIIGTGRVSSGHATAIDALAGTRLAGCAEVDPVRLAKFTERFSCPAYESYEELIARHDLDAVVITLPHWLHSDVTVACLHAGKHVLVEKPMAMTVAECDAMIAAAERSGKTLMVGQSQQFFPVNETARAMIAAGEIGRVVFATDTWYKPFYAEPRPAWFLDATKGGGMWPMNGPHMIDRMLMFIGSEVVGVKAMVGTYFVDVPATDTGVAILEFANGSHATIQHCGYNNGVDRFEGEITGTAAQLRLTGGQLWISREGRYEEVPVRTRPVPLKPDWAENQGPGPILGNQLAAFVEAVQSGKGPAVSSRYGREVVRILEACELSGRTRREVRLDHAASKA
jgi:predicted dehydrogenase